MIFFVFVALSLIKESRKALHTKEFDPFFGFTSAICNRENDSAMSGGVQLNVLKLVKTS